MFTEKGEIVFSLRDGFWIAIWLLQGGAGGRGSGLGWVDFDLNVPPCCPTAQLIQPNFHLPKHHQAGSGMTKIKVNQTLSTSTTTSPTLYISCVFSMLTWFSISIIILIPEGTPSSACPPCHRRPPPHSCPLCPPQCRLAPGTWRTPSAPRYRGPLLSLGVLVKFGIGCVKVNEVSEFRWNSTWIELVFAILVCIACSQYFLSYLWGNLVGCWLNPQFEARQSFRQINPSIAWSVQLCWYLGKDWLAEKKMHWLLSGALWLVDQCGQTLTRWKIRPQHISWRIKQLADLLAWFMLFVPGPLI